MPRNRSEKTVTGDADVDAALRAYSEYMECDEDEDAEDAALGRWAAKYNALSGAQQMLHSQHQNDIPKELEYVPR